MKSIIKRNSTVDGLCLVAETATSGLKNALSKALKKGSVKRLAPRVYIESGANEGLVIANNIFTLVAFLYPGAVISHRSAIESGLDNSKKHIVITHEKTGVRTLGGVTIHVLKGPPPHNLDMPFVDGLFISSPPRAWLECFQNRKTQNGFSKTLSPVETEKTLEQKITQQGEEKFKKLIDEVHNLAKELSWEKEAEKFQKIVGALLGTRPSQNLKTKSGIARQNGLAFDSSRDEIFNELFKKLRHQAPAEVPRETQLTRDEWSIICFFEAYFSNYIEGTKFAVDEAEKIVFNQIIPENRPEGHDVLGTYKIIFPMATAPKKIQELTSPDQFEEEICRIHNEIMQVHPEKKPGQYKDEANRVGTYDFVAPDLVKGTLHRGFEYLDALESPLQRALFLKFLVAEVHPFVDGNGRVSRVILNRELHRHSLWPILIPTVYRIDYRGGLKSLSLNKSADVFIKVLTKAQKITSALKVSSLKEAQQQLTSWKAFEEDESITFNWSLFEKEAAS